MSMNTPSSLAERLADVSATVRHRTLTQKRRDEAADIIDQAATALRPVLPPEMEELKRLAEAATQGPWTLQIDDSGGQFSGWPSIESCLELDASIIHRAGFKQEYWGDWSKREAVANARFIAAVNPQTVLKLIQTLALKDEEMAGLRAKTIEDRS